MRLKLSIALFLLTGTTLSTPLHIGLRPAVTAREVDPPIDSVQAAETSMSPLTSQSSATSTSYKPATTTQFNMAQDDSDNPGFDPLGFLTGDGGGDGGGRGGGVGLAQTSTLILPTLLKPNPINTSVANSTSTTTHTSTTPAPKASTTPASTVASSTGTTPVTSIGLATPSTTSSPSSSGALTEWKVIGVAVIVFSVVVGGILAVMFFDQWWSFLVAVTLGRRHGDWKEEFVPDWEKQSWEVRMDGDEDQRFPNFTKPSPARLAVEYDRPLPPFPPRNDLPTPIYNHLHSPPAGTEIPSNFHARMSTSVPDLYSRRIAVGQVLTHEPSPSVH